MAIKKNSLVENVEIGEMVAEGKCISKIDGIAVFTKFTAPGDIVDLRIRKKKKKYLQAEVAKIHSKSDLRVEPICNYFMTCGGCKWQHVDYKNQIEAKERQVKDSLERIGHLSGFELLPIIGSENIFEYRNKMEYTFTDNRWLTYEEVKSDQEFERRGVGLHVPGMFDKIIDLNKCHLQEDISNKVRNHIRDFAIEKDIPFFNIRNQEGQLRTMIVRTSSTGDLMVIIQFYYEDENCKLVLKEMKNKFPEITSLLYVINPKGNETFNDLEVKCYHGKDHIVEQMGDVKFNIGPKTFYQTNSLQAKILYDTAIGMAGITKDDLVYDLYTGAGTIANYVSQSAKHVVGVEYVESAIEDAKVNSEINNISNTSFFAGDMKDVLNDQFISANGTPDIIITDPPRAGMHEDVVNKMLEIGSKRIVYISCNPATQARDMELLSVKYNVVKVQAVDMFPHTHHVESVALLELLN